MAYGRDKKTLCIFAARRLHCIAFLQYRNKPGASHTDATRCFIGTIRNSNCRHTNCVERTAEQPYTIMKIAIPLCRYRIAPLFEAAETFVLFSAGEPDLAPTRWEARHSNIGNKCQQLLAAGVGLLLCGAISRRWQSQLEMLGIAVHPFLAGDVQEIAYTFQHEGTDGLERFAMPGRQPGGNGNRRRYRRRSFCAHHQLHEENDYATFQ